MSSSSTSSSSSSSSSSSRSPLRSIFTGSLVSAAVDGLMSCRADGSLLMWAVWMVSAICTGMSDEAILGGFLWDWGIPESVGQVTSRDAPVGFELPMHRGEARQGKARRGVGVIQGSTCWSRTGGRDVRRTMQGRSRIESAECRVQTLL